MGTTTQDSISLRQVAFSRSGDKGDHANVGVVAITPAGFDFLHRELTAARVGKFFSGLNPASVRRFELPGIRGFNFVLYRSLAGGASRSLRIDTQGKLLGMAIGDLELPRPDNLAEMLATPGE